MPANHPPYDGQAVAACTNSGGSVTRSSRSIRATLAVVGGAAIATAANNRNAR